MNIIKYFRKKNGYSQKYLSESLDVSRTTITRFENMSDQEILSKISLEQNENKIIIIAGNKNIPPININHEEISVMGIVVGVFFNT